MVKLTEIEIKTEDISDNNLKYLLKGIAMSCPLNTTIFVNNELVAEVANNDKGVRQLTVFQHHLADYDQRP